MCPSAPTDPTSSWCTMLRAAASSVGIVRPSAGRAPQNAGRPIGLCQWVIQGAPKRTLETAGISAARRSAHGAPDSADCRGGAPQPPPKPRPEFTSGIMDAKPVEDLPDESWKVGETGLQCSRCLRHPVRSVDHRVWKTMGIAIHTGTTLSRFSAGVNLQTLATRNAASSREACPDVCAIRAL